MPFKAQQAVLNRPEPQIRASTPLERFHGMLGDIGDIPSSQLDSLLRLIGLSPKAKLEEEVQFAEQNRKYQEAARQFGPESQEALAQLPLVLGIMPSSLEGPAKTETTLSNLLDYFKTKPTGVALEKSVGTGPDIVKALEKERSQIEKYAALPEPPKRVGPSPSERNAKVQEFLQYLDSLKNPREARIEVQKAINRGPGSEEWNFTPQELYRNTTKFQRQNYMGMPMGSTPEAIAEQKVWGRRLLRDNSIFPPQKVELVQRPEGIKAPNWLQTTFARRARLPLNPKAVKTLDYLDKSLNPDWVEIWNPVSEKYEKVSQKEIDRILYETSGGPGVAGDIVPSDMDINRDILRKVWDAPEKPKTKLLHSPSPLVPKTAPLPAQIAPLRSQSTIGMTPAQVRFALQQPEAMERINKAIQEMKMAPLTGPRLVPKK